MAALSNVTSCILSLQHELEGRGKRVITRCAAPAHKHEAYASPASAAEALQHTTKQNMLLDPVYVKSVVILLPLVQPQIPPGWVNAEEGPALCSAEH